MNQTSRRSFIGKSILAASGTMLLQQYPFRRAVASDGGPAKIPLGFQSYTIREMLGKDFAGTLKTMAGFGYKTVEMCSPPGYVNAGFGFLVGMKTSEMKQIINDAGLDCPSCHFGFKEFEDPLDERIQFAKELGCSQMVCSSFGLPKTAALRDYEERADKLNKAAEKIKQAGMETGFHNHEAEFAILDGQLIYDALLNRFDPALVKMQFQTEVINLGYKASTYFKKYPGRFISAHLSDWTSDRKQVPVGKGIIDWKEFFAAAETGGIRNFFVEMDFTAFKDSADYIRGM